MKRFVNRTGLRVAVLAGAALGLAGVANADVSQTIFSLTATNSLGSHTFSFDLPDSTPNPFVNGIFDWIAANPVMLPNGVEITGAAVHLEADPIVALSFGLNNTSGVDTNIIVSSPLLSFASISNAIGNASASVTLVDPQGDGATLTPIAGRGYRAFYNGGAPQVGTEFAGLFTTPITLAPNPPFGSATSVTVDFPGPGVFTPMGTVSDASAGWAFVLSDGDTATGSSTFEIIPTPGTGALLAFGALSLIRRRR